ncbi:MAG: PaaX family transcriptional regulator C-terminal domain-containing protein [Jannaschia sp.]
MTDAAFQDLIACLRGDRPPRVWSLLVTLFGDLALHDGALVSGALLRHLSDLLGVKPEAMRVALHRLRKDGWIDSERTGRTSAYVLTDRGRSQSAAASPRIYAVGPPADRAWLVVGNPDQPLADLPDGDVPLAPNLWITPHEDQAVDAVAMALPEGRALPDWMTLRLCDEDLITASRDLAGALAILQNRLAAAPDLTALQRAALRILIVHSWRRVVLKTPALPDHVFPTNWQGATCRAQVAQILAACPNPGLAKLEQAVATGLYA